MRLLCVEMWSLVLVGFLIVASAGADANLNNTAENTNATNGSLITKLDGIAVTKTDTTNSTAAAATTESSAGTDSVGVKTSESAASAREKTSDVTKSNDITKLTAVTGKPAKGPSKPECVSIKDIVAAEEIYNQAQFLNLLTDPCRYDKLSRPHVDNKPVNVYVQIDIRHIEAAEHLQFKMHMLLQYRFRDPRLSYEKLFKTRAHIVGEEQLRSKIWVPHVLLENERSSAIMGHDSKDIYVSISPSGEVVYSRRITATLYCWMDLQKFPFDEQDCDIVLTSWTYNTSDLTLQWEEVEPVLVAKQLHLTEYTLIRHQTESSIRSTSPYHTGAFYGNYSCLTFKFFLAREMGFYMMDYFIPSILLVTISWVSFWLQADASAPRITIGCSTMLSFITLASAQGKTLPKVSYIKASEIWFLGCTVFIFGSMVEFAFVNIIWRRKSNVVLKEVNSKNILKCTITPRLARRELQKSSNPGLHKSHSCSSLHNTNLDAKTTPQYNNYLTVHSFSETMTLPKITTESVDDLIAPNSTDSINIPIPTSSSDQPANGGWTTMTPQEISQWIDKRSRIVFPCAFLVFNALYWGFVYGI